MNLSLGSQAKRSAKVCTNLSLLGGSGLCCGRDCRRAAHLTSGKSACSKGLPIDHSQYSVKSFFRISHFSLDLLFASSMIYQKLCFTGQLNFLGHEGEAGVGVGTVRMGIFIFCVNFLPSRFPVRPAGPAKWSGSISRAVSYTHLRAHETG
jgi:hypothetical protein